MKKPLVRRYSTLSALLVGTAIGSSMLAISASAQSVQYTTGFEYTTGDYGNAEDTMILEVPLAFRYKRGNWSFRARTAFVSIDGPGGVIPGGEDDDNDSACDNSGPGGGRCDDDDVVVPPPPSGTFTETGIGDTFVSAKYAWDFADDYYLDTTGTVTLPTGDETRDLGVGETDYKLTTELGRFVNGRGAYVLAGYKFRGGEAREDGAQFGAGAFTRLSDRTSVGVDYFYSESSSDFNEASSNISGYVGWRMNDNLRLSAYALAGLSDNSPDYGVGLSLRWQPNARRPDGKF
jgi:hypothetical protein